MTKIGLSEHFTYRKLLRFVLPCIVMMIVTSIYTIVDGFFVSNYAGKDAFTALNLIYPLLMAMGALGFMIGTGGSALVSFTLGEGKRERANEIFTMLMLTIVVVGAVLSLLGFLFIRPIAYALGATEAILDECVLYGRILLAANIFFMLQNSYQSFLVTAERATMGLIISVASGVMNMVLDFVLVGVLDLGIGGAASATAASQFVGAIIPTFYFLRPNKSLLRFVRTHPDLRALGKADDDEPVCLRSWNAVQLAVDSNRGRGWGCSLWSDDVCCIYIYGFFLWICGGGWAFDRVSLWRSES